MADLDLGICRSLLLEKRQRTQSVIRNGTLQGGNFAVESVAAFEWNGRQLCLGIGGNFHVDWVATFTWNTHRALQEKNRDTSISKSRNSPTFAVGHPVPSTD